MYNYDDRMTIEHLHALIEGRLTEFVGMLKSELTRQTYIHVHVLFQIIYQGIQLSI